jgi:hypothetical protein
MVGEVSFDTAGVTYTPPSGAACRIAWSDLRAVEVATTDTGPFAEDVFWVLHGAGPPLVVPQSACGSDALLGRLQELPGFDSRAVIAAMSSAGNERFRVGREPDAEPAAAPRPDRAPPF